MRCVALLRGVNVGRANRIGMPALIATVEQLGHTGVVSHLQSGNVVFDTDRPAADVEAELTAALFDVHGLRVPVVLRSAEELFAAVAANPLEVGPDPKKFAVHFCASVPEPEVVAAIDPARYTPEAFAVVAREIFVRMPGGTQNTKLGQGFWERRLKMVATARNWNTVLTLRDLTSSP